MFNETGIKRLSSESSELLANVLDVNMMESDDKKLSRYAYGTGEHTIADSGLYEAAWTLQRSIEDRQVISKSLKVEVEFVERLNRFLPFLVVDNEYYEFTGTSFRQLCERSGMGTTAYMKKCIEAGLFDLVEHNLNAWLREQADKEFLLRLTDGFVIAVLSSRYGVFDHGDALECLHEVLGSDGRYEIEASMLSLDNMSIRLVDTEKIVLSDGSLGRDSSTAGLLFRNGQTGGSFASIEFLVYTFACTNGLIVSSDRGTVYRRKHIGIDREDFRFQISETLKQFPAYVERAKIDIEAARLYRLDGGAIPYLWQRKVMTDLAIGEDTFEKIEQTMRDSWDANVWGFAGAITEVAQEFSADRQYHFERYAGELVHRMVAR